MMSAAEDSIIITENNYREFADKYNSMFSALCLINEDNTCKLGVHNGKLYKSWNTLGGVQRTFYGESRDILVKYLQENMNKYIQFYNNVFSLLLNNRENSLIHEIATTIEVSKLNILNWIKGLKGIIASYPNDISIKTKINTIINSLGSILSKKVC